MSEIASVSASLSPAAAVPEPAGDHADHDKKKKKSKVRSAWISFIGRIVAQLFGAVATVMLGLQVAHKYLPTQADAQPIAVESTIPFVRPARTDGVKTLAVLPVADFTGESRHDGFSDGLTEALIAEFAQVQGVQVTSRTSSMHFRDQRGLLPSIARQLGVDLVLEASVVRTEGRIGITAQLIDASTDLHILARRYEFPESDVLTLHAAVARTVVRDVRAAGIGITADRPSDDPAGQ